MFQNLENRYFVFVHLTIIDTISAIFYILFILSYRGINMLLVPKKSYEFIIPKQIHGKISCYLLSESNC